MKIYIYKMINMETIGQITIISLTGLTALYMNYKHYKVIKNVGVCFSSKDICELICINSYIIGLFGIAYITKSIE